MNLINRLLLVGCLLFALQESSAQLALKVNVLQPNTIWESFVLKPGLGAEGLYLGKWEKPWRLRAGAAAYIFGLQNESILISYHALKNGHFIIMPGTLTYDKFKKTQVSFGADYRVYSKNKSRIYTGMEGVYEFTWTNWKRAYADGFEVESMDMFWNLAIKARLGFDQTLSPKLAVFGEVAGSLNLDAYFYMDAGIGVRYQFNRPK